MLLKPHLHYRLFFWTLNDWRILLILYRIQKNSGPLSSFPLIRSSIRLPLKGRQRCHDEIVISFVLQSVRNFFVNSQIKPVSDIGKRFRVDLHLAIVLLVTFQVMGWTNSVILQLLRISFYLIYLSVSCFCIVSELRNKVLDSKREKSVLSNDVPHSAWSSHIFIQKR